MNGADRWAWAEIDLGAVAHNVAVLRAAVAPAAVWAVVKADGYGHGAVEVGRAALAAGAEGLVRRARRGGRGVARAGIDAPILVLSEQPTALARTIVAHRLDADRLHAAAFVDALVAAGTRPSAASTSRSTPACSASARIRRRRGRTRRSRSRTVARRAA